MLQQEVGKRRTKDISIVHSHLPLRAKRRSSTARRASGQNMPNKQRLKSALAMIEYSERFSAVYAYVCVHVRPTKQSNLSTYHIRYNNRLGALTEQNRRIPMKMKRTLTGSGGHL